MVNQDEQHRKKSCRKKGKLKDQEYVKRYERGKFLVKNKGEHFLYKQIFFVTIS